MGWWLGLGIDESYMVAAGRTLRLGYFDHPPAAWWLSSGIAQLTGSETAIVVRLPFIALFAVSTWLMAQLTAALFTPRAGLLAAIAFNLAPLFGLTTGGWVLPDGPMIFALLAAGLCLVRALQGRGLGWWYGAGAAAGFALLSKYSSGLVLAGAFAAIVSQPIHRFWLRRHEPYVAAGIALLAFVPVLFWNAENGWASFAFQGGRAAGGQFRPFGPISTLAGQALFLLPWIWAGLMLVFVRGIRDGRADWRSWLLCCLAAPPILLFTAVSLWSRNVLFHWAAPGYLFLFPLLGAWLDRKPAPRVTNWAAGSAALIGILLVLVCVEVRYNRIGRHLRAPSPTLQALDWTALRPALAARGLLNGAVIAGPTWNDTGKLDYALGGDPSVLCLNTDARQYQFADTPKHHIGHDILIIAPRQSAERIEQTYASLFDRTERLAPVQFTIPGRETIEMPLILGHGLRRWP